MCFVNRGEFRGKEIFENHNVSSLHILPRNERTSLEPASPVLEGSSFKLITEESEQQGVGGPAPIVL